MTPSRRAFRRSLVFVVVVGLAGCGGSDDAGPPPRRIAALDADVPGRILGLEVRREDVTKALEQFKPAYVEAAALYSLRSEELVQATLQIARVAADLEHDPAAFRRAVVDQVGSSAPRATVMGERTVYRTTGTKQSVAVWFEGRTMYLLAVRDDFGKPRTLIRTIVDLSP